MEPKSTQPVIQSNISPAAGNEKKVGPIIATLIIVLVLIIAALYLFASRINQPAIPEYDSGTASTNSMDTSASGSTDLNSMQSDLNTSTSGVDNQNF